MAYDDGLASWMSKLPKSLRERSLLHLYIPGSHDSFSYSLRSGEVGPDSPSYVACLGKSPFIIKDIILKWSRTQKASTYDQLSHGIRYFDIRVALHNNKFYFVHLLLGSELTPVLIEIKNFLEERPGEAVILDFQHFYGLSPHHHDTLIAILKNIFSSFICPHFPTSEHVSLKFLSENKYQVVIIYRDSYGEKVSGFWPSRSLPNPWPNTTSVKVLMNFIRQSVKKRPPCKLYVTQCVLTATLGYILKHLMSSLEKTLASQCNKVVLEWVKSLPDCSDDLGPNVIMSDFVESSDWAIPKAVVQCNYELEKHSRQLVNSVAEECVKP